MNKVSIIMPCFNDGEYIEESISSVLNQTYKEIELIIVDDGSTDEKTINILNSIKNNKIKVIKSQRLRPAGARNLGISNASGKYILPLDSDDCIESDYVAKAVKILDENDNVGVVYCFADLFGEKNGKWELPDYSFEKMLLDNIVFVTSMFRRTDWIEVGGFNTELIHGMEDYDFWISILELNREIIQIPEVLFHYRIKSISRTTEFNENASIVKETYKKIHENHTTFYSKYSSQYETVLRNALIDQIFINRTLRKNINLLEKVMNNFIIKKIAKKFILK